MSEKNSVVAIFNIHTEAEAAVKELQLAYRTGKPPPTPRGLNLIP
jgi:hypothetical protein